MFAMKHTQSIMQMYSTQEKALLKKQNSEKVEKIKLPNHTNSHTATI